MFHGEFIKAKNFKGENYRNEKTGDLIKYCSHMYIIKPRFANSEELIAGEFTYLRKKFAGFEGICLNCGNFLSINEDNIVDDKTFDKLIDERVKEIKKQSKKKNEKK